MNSIDKTIRSEAQKMKFELPEGFDSFLSETFEKLDHKKCTGKKFLRKNIRTVLIAAVLVICLTASAFAVSDVRNWFVGYFASKAGEELTESQVELLEQSTSELGSSATCNGITVTAESITGDDYVVYIKLRIESETGLTLEGKDLSFRWGAIYLPDMSCISSSCGYKELHDEPSMDSCTYMLLTLNKQENNDGAETSDGSSEIILGLQDLCDGFNEGVFHYVAEGTWKMKLSYKETLDSIELINEPLQVYGDSLQDGKVSVKMTSFVLSSFGAACTYVIDDGFPAQAVAFDHVGVYMKDGTFARLIPGRSTIGCSAFKFEIPISLKEANYIQLDDNTRIYCESFFVDSTPG